jgi:hypothetical protein
LEVPFAFHFTNAKEGKLQITNATEGKVHSNAKVKIRTIATEARDAQVRIRIRIRLRIRISLRIRIRV